MEGLIRATEVPVIERDIQIAEAINRIDTLIQGRSVPDCILFYYGVSHIGKSTILRKIAQHVKEKGVMSAFIDFDRNTQYINSISNQLSGLNDRSHLLYYIYQDISKNSEFILRNSTSFSLKLTEYDVIAKILLESIRNIYMSRIRKPLVLFYDTIEDSDMEVFIWLQEHILEALVNEFPVLIIIASRTHPNKIVRDLIYPLERRTVKIALDPFDARQTEWQIEAIGAQELRGIGDELNRVTNGIPGLNDAAVRKLVEEKRRNPDAKLRSYLVVELVRNHIAQIDTERQWQRFLAVAPLRQFDAVLLRDIATKLFGAEDDLSSTPTLRALLQQFQKTRLVEPHPDDYGYAIPGHIRPVLDDYLRETNPIEYFEIHRIAANHFEAQVVKNDWVAIANRIYHLRGLQRAIALAPTEMRGRFIEQLNADLHPKTIAVQYMSDELQGALHRLSSIDPEHTFDIIIKIRRVLDEADFKRFIGQKIVDQLLAVCDDALNH